MDHSHHHSETFNEVTDHGFPLEHLDVLKKLRIDKLNIKLKSCILVTSLLFIDPSFALNGEGGDANCKHIINQKINFVKKWSGGCSNGYLYGDGELVLILSNTNEIRKYVGKFSDGYYAGVILRHDLEKNGQLLANTTHLLGYYENNDSVDIPVAVKINNHLQSYAYKDFDWYSIQPDGVHLDRKISFDEAMIIVKNFMATKGSDTMSYERFRAYLEGKLVFDPSQAVAQQTNSSPSTESASEATDELPQKGIFLDRRKKTKSKTKK